MFLCSMFFYFFVGGCVGRGVGVGGLQGTCLLFLCVCSCVFTSSLYSILFYFILFCFNVLCPGTADVN